MNRLISTLRAGVRQFADHPQLWLTVLVAVSIIGSFLFTAVRFSSIAQEAQEQLINVRVGALQDAFIPLAQLLIDDESALRATMQQIQHNNPTIRDFFIATKNTGTWLTTYSTAEETEGDTLTGYDTLFSLAETDPQNSYTVAEERQGERFFLTARSIPFPSDPSLHVIAVTRQSLSVADLRITENIRESVMILIVILLILLYLFFRHSRIIDYANLYRRLQEIDHMKDDFVSMTSHELRTPLTAIRGYIDALNTATARSDEDAKTLALIDESARRLNDLIADILDVARIQDGRLVFKIEEQNPRGLIVETCESLKPMAEHKGLHLILDVAEGPRIKVDSERLRQALINLIGNAIKYTDAGEIQVRGFTENNRYIIRVSDTGIGMSSDEQRQLFAKFYRSGSQKVRQQAGTGLGLWITKQIIEAMGGVISVESIQAVGSHFIVSFPVSKQ